jgi:CubicO group peptidase (beta-lactamase class C family)
MFWNAPHSFTVSVLAAALTFSVRIGGAQSVRSATDFSVVREHIRRMIAADSAPSLVVGVARGDSTLWEEGFGWADKERRVAADPTIPYSIASVTKSLTAVELLRLRERGLLDIDRPVNDYLGRTRVQSALWNDRQITIRRLATHTAGLATHYVLCFAGSKNCNTSVDRAIARYAVAIRLPGERFDYSNLGYGVLGAVIAGVTRRSYGEAMRDDVFRPLGMTHTFIGPVTRIVSAAASYTSGGTRADGYHSSTPAASDGYASVHDLLRFGEYQLHVWRPTAPAVLSDSAIEWMRSDLVRVDASQRYGFGWWIDESHDGIREVYAAGGTSVASALLILVPEERVTIALVSNTGVPLAELGDETLGAMLPRVAEQRAAATTSTPAPAPSRQCPQLLRGQWRGHISTYRGNIPFEVSFPDSGDARGRISNGSDTTLREISYSADGRVFATVTGDLGVDEYRNRPYDLRVELAPHGDLLTGYVTGRQMPGSLEAIGLSYPVRLERAGQ